MAKREYSNGYIPKIDYWISVAKEKLENKDVEGVKYAIRKAEYFLSREEAVYGNNVIAGVDFTQSLNHLNNLYE